MSDTNASGMPLPHEAQKQILALPGRFKIAVCGRRFGKTVAAAIAAVKKCEEVGARVVFWVSPIQSQSKCVEREIARWLKGKLKRKFTEKTAGFDPGIEWMHVKSERALVCSNGSRMEFHSAQACDHLRGSGLDLLVVDEAADVPEYVWESVLKPMLLDRQGEAYIIGTPRGKNHWLHRIFILGQAEESGGKRRLHSSIRFPSRANPKLQLEDIEQFKVGMDDAKYKQEFEAEFIDGADTIFAGVSNCIDGAPLERGRPEKIYITGIDLGQKHDFTVACSVAVDSDRLEGFARFNQLDWSVQHGLLKEHLEKFPGPVVVDTTGTQSPHWEFLHKNLSYTVCDFTFTASSRTDILEGLQIGIANRALKLANIREVLDELYSFSFLETAESRAGALGVRRKMGAPPGMHDDCVMALAMAWYGHKKLQLWGAVKAGPRPYAEGVYRLDDRKNLAQEEPQSFLPMRW